MSHNTVAIHESKHSEKVITFCTGIYELMKYCSKRQAIRIMDAAENGSLWGAYFTKTGQVRASYNF